MLVTSLFILGLSIYVEGSISLCYGILGFTKNVFGLNNFLLSFSESDFIFLYSDWYNCEYISG